MLAFSIDYYGIFFWATQFVELFCTYLNSVAYLSLYHAFHPQKLHKGQILRPTIEYYSLFRLHFFIS